MKKDAFADFVNPRFQVFQDEDKIYLFTYLFKEKEKVWSEVSIISLSNLHREIMRVYVQQGRQLGIMR